jgi:rhamnosyltransferase
MKKNINANRKIAVLLAAYNGLDFIGDQINSIVCQTGVDVTIFISVDRSSDGTHEWCLALARAHSNILVLPYGERFGGAAQNFFRLIRDVDFSSFDYVAFSDQDDLWLSEKLARALTRIHETSADAYSSSVIAFWPDGAKKLIQKAQPQRAWDYLFEAAGPGCTYVINISLATKIKAIIMSDWVEINKIALHDWFCYAYARANGFTWCIDEWPSVLYRQHASNQVGANSGFTAFRYRIRKVINGWGIKQSQLIANLVSTDGGEFVRTLKNIDRYGFLKLAFKARNCRRKSSEQALFFIACVFLAVVGNQRV